MIEVVFSDSACGSLRMAQHFGEGAYQSGAFSVLFCASADGSEPTEE